MEGIGDEIYELGIAELAKRESEVRAFEESIKVAQKSAQDKGIAEVKFMADDWQFAYNRSHDQLTQIGKIGVAFSDHSGSNDTFILYMHYICIIDETRIR